MSYAIFTTYFGIPLNSNTSHEDAERPACLEDLIEGDGPGVHIRYSSGSDTPVAFGVRLGEFDECCHHLEVTDVVTTITPAQMQEFHDLYNALDQEVRDAMQVYGEPRMFILVSSS